jgi:DNA helicase II / ATP-dependent DNA helicase PcrA
MLVLVAKAFWGLFWVGYMSFSYFHLKIMSFINPKGHTEFFRQRLLAFSRSMMAVMGIRYELENPEMAHKIDWSRNIFVAPNHQSYLDIPSVFLALQKPVGFVAKESLCRTPMLGYWMLQCGSILINRSEKGIGIQISRLIKERLANNQTARFVIFPEGTRSKTGAVGRLKSGVFRFAQENDGLLIPLVISGSRETFESRKKVFCRPVIKVKILEPIDFREYKKQGKTFKDAKDYIQSSWDEIFKDRTF